MYETVGESTGKTRRFTTAMADMVLVRDVTELGVVRQFFGDRLRDVQVYTLLPAHYLELKRDGIQPNIFSQHIAATDAYDIYRRAFQDITQIVDSFPRVEGLLPVNLAQYFKVYYWEYLTDVYALDMALEHILNCSDGVTFTYLQRSYPAPTRHAELTNADFISAQMLDALSRQRPSVVQPLPGGIVVQATERQTLRDAARSLLVSLKRVAKGLLLRGRGLTVRPAPPVAAEARAIAFGSGYDALVVIPDALRLATESGLKPLWTTEGVDKKTTRSGLVYRDEYDQIERFSISRYLAEHPVPPLTSAEASQADKPFPELMDRLNQIEVISRYGLTSGMSKLRQEFRHALWRTKVIDRVLAHFTGSTLVITNYNGIDERAIEQLAPRHQIEVIARPHGWIANIEGFEYQASRYLVSGKLWRELATTFYGEDTPTYISPDPSLVNAAKEWLGKTEDKQQAIVDQKRRALSIQTPYVVLFMTTAARTHILNEFDYPALQGFWWRAFDYLKAHPDVHVVIKSHKNNFDWWVATHAAERGVTNLTILGGRLEDAVIQADLVVDLGKPGSATLVSLLFRKPTLLYRGLYKYVRQLGDLTYAAGASLVVDGPEALILELEKLRAEGATYLADLKSRNRSLLEGLATL